MDDPGRPSARLLDLTRLMSRVGRGAWTGIDRVEAAYLAHLLNGPGPRYFLVRRPDGIHLLDETGGRGLADRLTGRTPWGGSDLRARLHLKATAAQQAAETDLRRLAVDRCGQSGLARMLARYLPEGAVWLNTGHSNLSGDVFDAVQRFGGRAVILVHDVIPLDFPEYQRAGTVEAFREKMRAVAGKADLVICPSAATRADVERHFAILGRVPPLVVAPLGIGRPVPDPAALPVSVDPSRPYFVVLGTIEPRKNHSLLLNIWEHFAETLAEAEIPALHIVGARGWANEALFARLDRSQLTGRHVFEHAGLGDGAAAAMVQGARALLMPSLAEGFGLPPAEALALGTPVIATELPVYREVLGNNPVYLDGRGLYSWANEILKFARGPERGHSAAREGVPALPTWQDHFDLVFKGL